MIFCGVIGSNPPLLQGVSLEVVITSGPKNGIPIPFAYISVMIIHILGSKNKMPGSKTSGITTRSSSSYYYF